MARMILIFALCVLPALISATRLLSSPFILRGRVYCDTCRAGYETSATKYIAGAMVNLECRATNSPKVLYRAVGTTDSTGTFEIMVKEDHENQVCDCVLDKSPLSYCATPDPGRNSARVILTRNNGIVPYERYANSMGYLIDEPMSGCTQLLQQYQESED